MKKFIDYLLSKETNVKRKNTYGFTLIEMICVLILIGILGSFLFQGYINTVHSQVNTNNNYHQVQKDQIAILRLLLEMQLAESVVINSNSISYTYNTESRSIFKSNDTLVLQTPSGTGESSDHILTDNVSAFSSSYSSATKILSLTITTNYSPDTTKTINESIYMID